ncbi:MAG: hypothetical protein D3909_00140 [Candidatus Electrothrix sp. ATG1]|nr:hypothetical protein [Candidatus Electrothrix sp. ATG1]
MVLSFSFLIIDHSVSKELFVSLSGDNNVSYDNNDINNPWKTINHGIYNVKAGDILYVRGGVYTPKYSMWLRSDYASKTYGGDPSEDMVAESGTVEQPVLIKNYNNEEVVVDCINKDILIHLDNKSYWKWEGLRFINSNIVFNVGQNSISENNQFIDIVIERIAGGDNYGGITLLNKNAEHTFIKRCKIVGPAKTGVHLNTAGIWLKSVNYVKILNCEIADVPIGIYYKHANLGIGSNNVDIEIAYNYIYNTGRNALQLNCNYANIHNNLIGQNNADTLVNEANGVPGGDFNNITNNTFFSGSLVLSGVTQEGDSQPGAVSNTLLNNLFLKTAKKHEYSSNAHNTISDYNLYRVDSAVRENRIDYKLMDWRGHSNQDGHSQDGTPEFIVESPSTISEFKLASHSLGVKAGNDNKDIGADIGMVGITSIQAAASMPIPSVPKGFVWEAP